MATVPRIEATVFNCRASEEDEILSSYDIIEQAVVKSEELPRVGGE